MARLIAKTPAEGLLPVEVAGVRLSEVDPGGLTSVAALGGADIGAALKAATGASLPGPGATTTGRGGARVVWFGVRHVLVMGPPVAALDGAAVTDQSDAWCTLRLDGAGARDVLARLTPLDLRPSSFAEGATARTLLGHMQASITRVEDDAYLILVFRSMAKTAVHEITEAMESRAARLRLT
ncbi:sarcosine oxidase subunit gamma [Anianabacter salinae]|uniref:sarcosine oxidase subunit gamma n=1 Tax=Anianabacter salinae TaxID=2851023 RepID=UPI00225E30E0|nr:sarcosine oxidase subunit gamma family protein [Anianabacter salinae]